MSMSVLMFDEQITTAQAIEAGIRFGVTRRSSNGNLCRRLWNGCRGVVYPKHGRYRWLIAGQEILTIHSPEYYDSEGRAFVAMLDRARLMPAESDVEEL